MGSLLTVGLLLYRLFIAGYTGTVAPSFASLQRRWPTRMNKGTTNEWRLVMQAAGAVNSASWRENRSGGVRW